MRRRGADVTPSGCSRPPSTSGIAEPDRAVSLGAARHRELPRGRSAARARPWYEGGGAVGDRAVQGITIYPPTRGVQTQGDPFEPVKIGILIDMDLGQLLADWIDPTILAIEDALNEGVYGRGPIQLVIADARGLPRENYRKVHRRLPLAGRAGLRRRARPDDLATTRSCVQDTANELRVACIGWTGAHRFASDYCFTVANGDIPTEGVMCAQWLAGAGHREGRHVLGAGLVGHATTPTTSATPRCSSASTVMREVKLEPNPRGLKDDLAHRCATSASRASTTAATATPRSTSPRRSRRSTGTRPG